MHAIPSRWDITREQPRYQLVLMVAFLNIECDDYDQLGLKARRAPEYIRLV